MPPVVGHCKSGKTTFNRQSTVKGINMENDSIHHPQHYQSAFKTKEIECIDITKHLGFIPGNVVKYVWRAGKKGGIAKAIEDLEKALEYMDMLREEDSERESSSGGIAAAVFEMLKEPDFDNDFEGLRYSVIDYVVHGWGYQNAYGLIQEMKKILKLKADTGGLE